MTTTIRSQGAGGSSTAVVVIDVQNDFCDDAGVHGQRGSDLRWVQQVVQPIDRLLQQARLTQAPVIFVRTHHDRWSDRQDYYLREGPVGPLHHLQPGGWGSEFYGLCPGPDDHTLTKRRWSAFFGTELEILLRNLGIQTLIVTGVATNVCVDTTVRDACMRDLDVVVVRDCVAAYSEDEHEAALRTMGRHFARVTSLEETLAELGASAGSQTGGRTDSRQEVAAERS